MASMLSDRLLKEAARLDRRRALRPLERRMARDVARLFVDQGRQMVRALGPLRRLFDANAAAAANATVTESVVPSDWLPLLMSVLAQMSGRMEGTLAAFYSEAVAIGVAEIGGLVGKAAAAAAQIEFMTPDPFAIAYAQQNAASRVTAINQTTRERLNNLLTQAVSENWGWERTAKAIDAQFKDFAGSPLFPSKKFVSRSQAIAAFEIGDAYERAKLGHIEYLESQGLIFEEKWLDSHDGKVRDEHAKYGAEGWQPRGYFVDRPPTDPGCRCTVVYRVRKAAE